MSRYPSRAAFTLIELAVVLTIIGLIIGGVVVGADMIKAAGLNAIVSEQRRFVSAINAFRDKYQYLPGDMPNATSFWGIAGGTGSDATCSTTISTDAKTCNGDGNGRVTSWTGSVEYFRFWQQLASAGFIEGQYSGYLAPSNNYFLAGTNAPGSRIDASAFWMPYTDASPASGSAFFFDGQMGNRLGIATVVGATASAVVKPLDALSVDIKVDDGKPYAGVLRAPWSATYSQANVACTTASNSADFTATYRTTDFNKDCVLWFYQSF